jgi:hypothetical protein
MYISFSLFIWWSAAFTWAISYRYPVLSGLGIAFLSSSAQREMVFLTDTTNILPARVRSGVDLERAVFDSLSYTFIA